MRLATFSLAILCAVFLIAPRMSNAEVPHKISYQGLLTDGQGKPINDGDHAVTFTLYSDPSGTTVAWRQRLIIQTSGGVFNVVLGDSGPGQLQTPLNDPLWLGISIEDSPELRPITPLVSAPYALGIADSTVGTFKLQDNAVTRDKIADDYVGHVTLNSNQFRTAKGRDIDITFGQNLVVHVDTTSPNTMRVIVDGLQGGPSGSLVAMPTKGPYPGYTATGDSLKLGDTWVFRAITGSPRVWGLPVEVSGKVYLFGGDSGSTSSHLRSVEVYDLGTDSWTAGTTMPTPRIGFSGAAVNGKIYLFGGMSPTAQPGAPALNTVEEFDPNVGPGGTWTTKSPMPTGRGGATAVALNGKIYTFGGIVSAGTAGVTPSSAVEVYDPATNGWATINPMPFPRTGVGAVVTNNSSIIVLCGYRYAGTQPIEVDQILELNPSSGIGGTWTAKGLFPLGGPVSAVGIPNGHILGLVEAGTCVEYNPALVGSRAVAARATIPYPISGSLVASGGRLFAIGGTYTLTPALAQEYIPPTFRYYFTKD